MLVAVEQTVAVATRPWTRGPARAAPAALGVTVLVLAAAASWSTASQPAPPTETTAAVVDALSRGLFRLVGHVAASATVGCLVLALLAGPSEEDEDAARLAAAAARWATLWACCVAWAAVLRIVGGEPATAAVVAAWVSGVVAVLARTHRNPHQVVLLLALTWAALVPAVLAGHDTPGARSLVSAAGLLVHVAAVSVWVGMILAVVVHTTRTMRTDPELLRRVSRVALVCFVAVAGSGALNVLSTVSWESARAGEPFAAVVAGKVALFVVLAAMGLRHRRRTLPSAAHGDPAPFRALVRAEAAVLVVALGLATALTYVAPEGPAGADEWHGHALTNR